MGVAAFLSLVLGLGLGRLLGAALPALLLPLMVLSGAIALGLFDRHYGYWTELRPFWRRGLEYLVPTVAGALAAGYALYAGGGVTGALVGLAAWSLTQAAELAAGAALRRKRA